MSSNYNYAASLAAFRNACDNVIFEHMATVFTAGSDEEAQAYADAIAHEAYVDEAGWTGRCGARCTKATKLMEAT